MLTYYQLADKDIDVAVVVENIRRLDIRGTQTHIKGCGMRVWREEWSSMVEM